MLADGNQRAELLTELAEAFFGLLVARPEAGHPQLLPAWDVLPAQQLSPHTEIAEQRAIGLWRMANRSASASRSHHHRSRGIRACFASTMPPIIAASPSTSESAKNCRSTPSRRISNPSATRAATPWKWSANIPSAAASSTCSARKPPGLCASNSLAMRSSPSADSKSESQRSVMKISEAQILPLVAAPLPPAPPRHRRAAEYNGDQPGDIFPGWEFAAALTEPRPQSLLDLAPDSLVVLDEPEQLAPPLNASANVSTSYNPSPLVRRQFLRVGRRSNPPSRIRQVGPRLQIRELDLDPTHPHIATRPSLAFHGNMQVAVAEARTMVEQGYRVAFFAPTLGELERLADILREYSVPFQLGLAPNEAASPYLAERAYLAGPVASTYLIKGLVRRGVVFPDSSVAFIGLEDLFDASDMVARPGATKKQLAAFASDLADLKPGDYVVHATHGVGRFAGLTRNRPGRAKGRFHAARIRRRSQALRPSHAHGPDREVSRREEKPRPLSIDSAAPAWTARKSRVKAKMRDMADELLKLYAERRMADGFAFSPDSNWQREFEDSFELHRNQGPASGHQGDQARPGIRRIPWTACYAAT